MTLEEAIEILMQRQKGTDPLYLPKLSDAIELGIEALKAIKECRASHMFCPGFLMSGETEERNG